MISELLTYRKSTGLIGQSQLHSTREQLDRLQQLLSAIEKLERRSSNYLASAQNYSGSVQELYQFFSHRANISRLAAQRLKNTFNISANEIQL